VIAQWIYFYFYSRTHEPERDVEKIEPQNPD